MVTNTQLKEIKALQQECEIADEIQLKLNWDMLRKSSEDDTRCLFHYDNGELTGFLGIYGFGSKVELCGMVKPEQRRKGIFSKLFHEAIKTLQHTQMILLNAPGNSQSAKEFLQTITCEYDCSEYQMQWKEIELIDNEEVTLRPSTENDLEDEIQLDIQCFGFKEADARQYNNLRKNREADGHFMIEHGGKTVGKIRISHLDGETWIYGFSVFPKYQGKGIGRNTLTKTVIQESQKGFPIFLEVEAKNAHALRLYESCGFQAYYSQDYYKFNH
ncbi:MAG: GNAT family N-acetyltransferase [Bacillota bacterium]|nr:GNAT family N-acetyltransferase [Bacillota bacterium]